MTHKLKVKERTMVRWLLALGACRKARAFKGMTPKRAWSKASEMERLFVMSSVDMPHNPNCPMCFPEESPKALPKKVLSEFRKFQRTGILYRR